MSIKSFASSPLTSSRISRISRGERGLQELIQRMVEISRAGLPLMFRTGSHEFAFTRRRCADGEVATVGTSLRYGAMTLLSAMYLREETQRQIFGGQTALEFCGLLISKLSHASSLGDICLVAWAAAELKLPDLSRVIGILQDRERKTIECYTVEGAWALSALVSACKQCDLTREVTHARDRLLHSFSSTSGLFRHRTDMRLVSWHRRHVACFADQVYPIQALARYHKEFRHGTSLDIAARCADQICRLQGDAGQWWWHYDVRNGSTMEGYPVYSVHQDAMAPMALLDLSDAGGPDHADSIRLGLSWMIWAPEVRRSLVDDEYGLIWRKVGRSDPGKLVRSMRALAARLHRGARLEWLDSVYRPTIIDYECRPYHFAWLLYAWLGGSNGNA